MEQCFNTEFLNTHQSEFIKVWLSLLVKNPKLYLEAWELNTCGFWGLSFWELNNDPNNIAMGMPKEGSLEEPYNIKIGSLLGKNNAVDMLLKKYFSIYTPMPAVAVVLMDCSFYDSFSSSKGKNEVCANFCTVYR